MAKIRRKKTPKTVQEVYKEVIEAIIPTPCCNSFQWRKDPKRKKYICAVCLKTDDPQEPAPLTQEQERVLRNINKHNKEMESNDNEGNAFDFRSRR